MIFVASILGLVSVVHLHMFVGNMIDGYPEQGVVRFYWSVAFGILSGLFFVYA